MKPHLCFTFLFGGLCLFTKAVELKLDVGAEHQKEGSEYWSPGFKLCWEEIMERNPDLRLTDPEQFPLMRSVMEMRYSVEDNLPPDSFFAKGGPATLAFEKQLNEVIRGRFPGAFEPITVMPKNEHSLYALTLLDHSVQFRKPFFESKTKGLTFTDAKKRKTEVTFFGVTGKKSADFNHVRVLDFAAGQRAAIGIPLQGNDEHLFLLMDESLNSFRASVDRCRQLILEQKELTHLREDAERFPRIHAKDDLRIPYVKFHADSELKKQLRSPVFRDGKTPWRLANAEEQVAFELTESGTKVRLKSQSHLEPFGGPLPAKATPLERKIHFDRPFYLFLWRTGAKLPYFAVRIQSPDLLSRF
ncbi:MAG: serpin family protein [Verrucomicrobiota bacterium JB023]|nr:serpin family protein [Verrucomicrobiota bacterium JB023]